MGLIKTAMMSGAAMYGINQLAKTAQSRHPNQPPPPPRNRESSDRDYTNDSYAVHPLEFREPTSRGSQGYTDSPGETWNPQSMQDRPPRQRLYLEDQAQYPSQYPYRNQDQSQYRDQYPPEYQPRYMQPSYDDRPQYDYAPPYTSNRSASAPSLPFQSPRRGQGFIEPNEITDDSSAQQGGSRGNADIVSMLAQQAMSMGLVGGKKGKKDKDSKENLLGSLIGK